MRIWLAPSAFFPARGGVEELTLQLARQYQSRGHDVTVVVHRHPSDLPARSEVEGVPVVRLRFDLPGRHPVRVASYPLSAVRQMRDLDAASERPDLIHVQCPSNQVPALAAYATRRRVPLVITTQGEVTMDAAQIYQHSAQMRVALRAGSRVAARLTACSQRAADDAATVARRFAKARAIPNGVDPDQWSVTPLPGTPTFAAWGRHVPQKGFDLLIAAFAKVRAEVPDAVLRLGGDGSQTPALRELAGAGVEFVGSLDRPGVQRLLADSQVAVVPSRLEPFGIVAVEAMAAGRGVVWSTNGGLADATGGQGWGVDPTDIDALSDAMIAAYRQPVDPGSARAHAESLSWARIADTYLREYEDVLFKRVLSNRAGAAGEDPGGRG